MGLDGDFTINSTDPWPWFSRQHDVGIENDGTGVMRDIDRLANLGLPATITPLRVSTKAAY